MNRKADTLEVSPRHRFISMRVPWRQVGEAAFGPMISLQLLHQICQREAEPLIGSRINLRNLGSNGSYIFQREDFS